MYPLHLPQLSMNGIHAMVTKLVSQGVPMMLVGFQDDVQAAIDVIKKCCRSNTPKTYPIDLWMPTDDWQAVYKYRQMGLTIV